MGDLSQFLQLLKQPEYVHILLNHWPVEGMVAGIFFLLFALFRRDAKGRGGALLWLALMGAACWMTVRSGQQGYDRVLSMSSPDASEWLKVHMYRAETYAWAFYATGLAALGGLLAQWKWQKISQGLAWATLFLAILSVTLGGWISHAGGQVRHSEFREGPPLSGQLPDLEEDHLHGHE